MTMVVGTFTNLMTPYGTFIYIYLIQSCKMPLLIQLISINYWLRCLRKTSDKRWNNVGSNIWMRKALYGFHFLLSDVFLIKSYQFFLDKAVNTPGYGKDVVYGFNAFHKQYLATCLIIRSTPEKDTIDSKRMPVYAMP